ncbi:hypothetical protein BDW22DRAFT_960580 [Trametopsis cervina]|nr:hypothetical protein BDW22DRAFT_960580 [Trametopsis cervina]
MPWSLTFALWPHTRTASGSNPPNLVLCPQHAQLSRLYMSHSCALRRARHSARCSYPQLDQNFSNARYQQTPLCSPIHTSAKPRTMDTSVSPILCEGPPSQVDVSDEEPTLIVDTRRNTAVTGEPNFHGRDVNGDFLCLVCYSSWTHAGNFMRHVYTHYPHLAADRGAPVVCCGVPIELRRSYPVPENALVRMFNGYEMVGGCGKVLSRPDVLRNHLRNKNNACGGDMRGFWHRTGNV